MGNSTMEINISLPPYIRSKGFVNRPRAARREPMREIIIIMTRYKGADDTFHPGFTADVICV